MATLRALRYHGGATVAASTSPDRDALIRGMANLDKHVENVRRFGLEPVVALNLRDGDPEDQVALVTRAMTAQGVACGVGDVFRHGGAGALELVDTVLDRARHAEPHPTYLYALSDPADRSF